MHTHSLSINSDPGRALRPWELALLLAVCVTLLTGTWAQARSQLLAARLVRLHVIAVSDDDAEQAVKLQVRDAVLAYLEPQLQGVTDVDAAQQLIAGDLDGIARAAQAAAGERPVRVGAGPRALPDARLRHVRPPGGGVHLLARDGSARARGTTGGASSSRRCARRRRDCRSRRCRRSRTTMCASSRSPTAAMSCASGCWSCGTRSCSG